MFKCSTNPKVNHVGQSILMEPFREGIMLINLIINGLTLLATNTYQSFINPPNNRKKVNIFKFKILYNIKLKYSFCLVLT